MKINRNSEELRFRKEKENEYSKEMNEIIVEMKEWIEKTVYIPNNINSSLLDEIKTEYEIKRNKLVEYMKVYYKLMELSNLICTLDNIMNENSLLCDKYKDEFNDLILYHKNHNIKNSILDEVNRIIMKSRNMINELLIKSELYKRIEELMYLLILI